MGVMKLANNQTNNFFFIRIPFYLYPYVSIMYALYNYTFKFVDCVIKNLSISKTKEGLLFCRSPSLRYALISMNKKRAIIRIASTHISQCILFLPPATLLAEASRT